MIFFLLLSLIIQFIVSYRVYSKSDIFYILSLQPIILLLNVGIVSILDSFVYLNFQNKVYELLLVALCELVLAFAFKIEIKLSDSQEGDSASAHEVVTPKAKSAEPKQAAVKAAPPKKINSPRKMA